MNLSPVVPTNVRIVVADANVLYPRVVRDYLLIAAEHEIIEVHWSPQILTDMADHLVANRHTFDKTAAHRLTSAMTRAFPDALITPQRGHFAHLEQYTLPDDDDRDVMATALACEADIICTDNIKHFPTRVMDDLGLTAMTADALFLLLMDEYLPQMIDTHRMTVTHFRGATDDSTLAALRKAGAQATAHRMARALGLDVPT